MDLTRSRLTVGAALAVLCSAGFLNAQRTSQSWSEMLAIGNELQRSIESADTTREVLHGTPIQALAFDEYSAALARVDESTFRDLNSYRVARHQQDEASETLRDALLDQHRETLRLLEEGARSTDAHYSIDEGDGSNSDLLDFKACRSIAELTVAAADRHLCEGHPESAVNVLLDGMQFSRDLHESPLLINDVIGIALLAITSKEALIDNGLLERFPAPQLERLAAGMAKVDASIAPVGHAMDGDLVRLASNLTNVNGDQEDIALESCSFFFGDYLPRGFSERATLSKYVTQLKRDRDLMHTMHADSWSERRAALEDIAKATSNPIFADSATRWLSAEASRRAGMAVFRLARIATEYRATGTTLPLADPFGGEFDLHEQDGTLHVECKRHAGDHAPSKFEFELTRE